MLGKTEEQKIKQEEEKLEEIVERVEQAEERIEKEERKIISAQESLLKRFKTKTVGYVLTKGLTQEDVNYLKKVFVLRIARHKFIFAVLVTFALVSIWRGTWHTLDETPILSNALISLLIGYLIIWLLEKYTELH